MREARALLGSLLAIALAACDEEPQAHPASPDDEAPVLERVVPSPGATDPSGPAEACAHDLEERTPPEVRATLGDLGYESLFDDVCVVQRAERAHDPAICAELSVSTLRVRCAARVAIAGGHPSECPTARTIEGRDPLCVALAARDRRLCVAAGPIERAVCESALGRERACDRLPDETRDACVARAAELGARIEGEVRTTPALEASLTLTLRDGTTRPTASADRGARVGYVGCTRVLSLGDAAHLLAPLHAASVAFAAVASDDGPLEVRLTELPSDLASTLSLTLDGMRTLQASGGTLSIGALEPALGAPIEGTFHATFAGTPASVDGTFRSFVRDVDPRPAECGPPAREL